MIWRRRRCSIALAATAILALGQGLGSEERQARAAEIVIESVTTDDGSVVVPYADPSVIPEVGGALTPPFAPSSSTTFAENVEPTDVYGDLNRERVSNTRNYFASAVTKIKRSNGGDCTGWMIGVRTVLTAGHCIFNRDTAQWSRGVEVIPGKDESATPFGVCGARKLCVSTAYKENGTKPSDWGAIKLDCPNKGDYTGWFGLHWRSGSLDGFTANINAYDANEAVQWKTHGTVNRTEPQQLFYKNDTFGGNSGAPVYGRYDGHYPIGIAIHAYGGYGADYEHLYGNRGTRITEARFNTFLAIRRD